MPRYFKPKPESKPKPEPKPEPKPGTKPKPEPKPGTKPKPEPRQYHYDSGNIFNQISMLNYPCIPIFTLNFIGVGNVPQV